MVYGGTIAPGCYKGEQLNIVSAFEALGKKIAGEITEEDFDGVVKIPAPELVHVVECIQPIQWLPR